MDQLSSALTRRAWTLLSLQKIFGLNLSLHAREALGIPISPYAALRAAKISASEKLLSLILEPMAGIEPATPSFAYTSSFLSI